MKETWGSYLREKFKENQDKIAVVDIGKNVRCTYRDLQKRSYEIEKAFISYNISRGTHVAMLFPSSSKWIATFLALINIGAIPICLDSSLTAEEMKYRVGHSDAKFVVTNEEVYKNFRKVEEELGLDMVVIENRQCECSPGIHCGWHTFIDHGQLISDEKVKEVRGKVRYDDILAIQYTSGTTGTPKAVMSVHYKVLSNVKIFVRNFGYTDKDRIFTSLPMYHMMGCFYSCLLAFEVGASVVLMGKFKTQRVIEALIEERCTSIHAVPSMYKLILNKMGNHQFQELKKGMIAGAYCDSVTINKIKQKMNIKYIFAAYGQTEGNGYTQITMNDPEEKVEKTVGKSIEGIEIKIVNDKMQEVPADTEGEIIVKSAYKMVGYYKDLEATNKIIQDEWIYTGDLGKMDKEGYLTITGRKKDIIIRGGDNISPIDIETVLKRCSGIKDAVVVGVPDEIMGQEIGAFVIVDKESKVHENEKIIANIKSYLTQHLAKYEIPKYIKCVDKFPLTGSGKIQRSKLLELI